MSPISYSQALSSLTRLLLLLKNISEVSGLCNNSHLPPVQQHSGKDCATNFDYWGGGT